MASAQAQAEAVRCAIVSVTTCTPTTSATLKELLADQESDQTSKTRPTKTPKAPSRNATKSKNKEPEGLLSAKDKALLASQVVNATLKALGDAVKNPEISKTQEPPAATRKKLRRSNSLPAEPLQPRSLNRSPTSPVASKTNRAPTVSTPSTGCLAAVECARSAFSCLRLLQSSGTVKLPELQLESGMSSFINKLLGLNLYEHAVKELRLLKRRLEAAAKAGSKTSKPTTSESTAGPKPLSDLLDYQKITASGALLALIITAQQQALRVIHALKKAVVLDNAIGSLRLSSPSSPINLVLLSQRDEKHDRIKCARQLENLAQILLSLTPSIANKDDATAVEARLNPSPETSLEIQTLGLIARLQMWKVSGHKADLDKEVLLPLSKCLATFTRRTGSGPVIAHDAARKAFTQVWDLASKLNLQPAATSSSPLAAIYQLLASTSREAGDARAAQDWITRLKTMSNPSEDSPAKCCAVTAQLLAISLKQSTELDETLMTEVMNTLQGSLSGNKTELDDLLVSVCVLRKAAMSVIVGNRADLPVSTRNNLESFTFSLPRFALRWLGKAPESSNSTKDFLRFDQRRQLLSEYLPHILDSALMLTKSLLDGDRLEWERMDSIFQESLAILETMGASFQPGASKNPAASYHVKISHLYYQKHLALRKSDTKAAETASLRALRRSIESIKNQSDAEQLRAQLLVKWERFSELCRASGRKDDAANALRSMRDHLIQRDTVSLITSTLEKQPVSKAWQQSAETQALSRAVCGLARIDRVAQDWTWLLIDSEADKATALEHDLYFCLAGDEKLRREAGPSNATSKALLKIYSLDKYPIRRLRTLLHLLANYMDANTEVLALREEAEAIIAALPDLSLGPDEDLARYIPHFQSHLDCIAALLDGCPNQPKVTNALASWRQMISKCQGVEDVLLYIDEPVQFLTSLQAVADGARIRGHELVASEILELALEVSRLAVSISPDCHIVNNVLLSVHQLSLGQSAKAEKTLSVGKDLLAQLQLSQGTVAQYYLASTEYYLAVGDFKTAEQVLNSACEAASKQTNRLRNPASRISMAQASYLTSALVLERGDSQHALQYAKTAVKILFGDWSRLEESRSYGQDQDTPMEDGSHQDISKDDTSLTTSRFDSTATVNSGFMGPEFWAIAQSLYWFTTRLSSLYAHAGMYQETLYYAEQACKVARSTGSTAYSCQASSWLASVWLMASNLDKALELAEEAKRPSAELEPTCGNILMLCQLSRVYREAKKYGVESELLEKAEQMLNLLSERSSALVAKGADCLLAGEMDKLSIQDKPVAKAPARQRTTTRATTRPRAATVKTTTRKATITKPKPPIEVPSTTTKPEHSQLAFLRAEILQHRSIGLLREQNWGSAAESLQTALGLSKLSADMSKEQVLMAMSLVGESLEQMSHDPIFFDLRDSTLSFPSVSTTKNDKPAHASKSAPGSMVLQDAPSFVAKLHQAQEHLVEAQSIASLNGNGSLLHQIAVLQQDVFALLSATSGSGLSEQSHLAYGTCSIELARNLTWRRERKALLLDSSKGVKPDWPTCESLKSDDDRRLSLNSATDMSALQRDFVDIIPDSWNVVSVSLSDTKRDLCITQLRAGQSPFSIRLPLGRAHSRDADNEIFSFEEGRSELLDIIERANRTCHDARDMSSKEAKAAWWAEREELDARMKKLMGNVEDTWFGGFRGLLTPASRRDDLIAKFQKSFSSILDKHLPSRRKVRGRRAKSAPTMPKIQLDSRIMNLFTTLADASDLEDDMDEALTDLLYFVVDILQFHGERNALDEVDFDEMVVETLDALHAYAAAANHPDYDEEKSGHTILILDKALHIFPWESLPCALGRSISRMPSLACLRRAIMERKANSRDTGVRDGHHVSVNSGTYILNPGADLTNTQSTFGKPLSSLPATWNSIESRAPSETEFETALSSADIMLYFGHGSGAQYIRGRTIRKMEKCRAVALLMGCSSASLAHVGEFECHGPAWNYMLAGSPAVVGTLWDVTDRDIDRFAGRMFEEWGLLPKGTFRAEGSRSASGGGGTKTNNKSKGKGKATDSDDSSGADDDESGSQRGGDEKTSLVEAVSRARDACRFRYLTAAAVCVYGIPVYIASE